MNKIKFIFGVVIAGFIVATVLASAANAQFISYQGMRGYQNIIVMPSDDSSRKGDAEIHVQKVYDHDEGVLCYVYYRHGISCIKDQ